MNHCEKIDATDWPEFTFAYQPIVDIREKSIVSFEALVRGPKNQDAAEVFAAVGDSTRFLFDEFLRSRAIELAQQLGISCRLNLNLIPRALAMLEDTIDAALKAADNVGFERELITLEFKENDIIDNIDAFNHSVKPYRNKGVKFAIDNFGSDYSSLNLISGFRPDIVKIDINLVRNIHLSQQHSAIVEALVLVCQKLGLDIIAGGVETKEEFSVLNAMGVNFYQGYLFSHPGFEHLPEIDFGYSNLKFL